MSDLTPAGSRQLTESERQAFQRLGLTPGHWAALGPAPLFYRPGLRAPSRRFRSDLEMCERLRRALWTVGGMSAEAGHFWDRLGDAHRAEEARLAARLLAWHLATDLSFAHRTVFIHMLGLAADHFIAHNTDPRAVHEAVQIFRWQVDACLPFPEFVPGHDPPWTPLPPPGAEMLDTIARTVLSPVMLAWPVVAPFDAPRVLPSIVRVLGEPVSEWWGEPDPARRAVERGLASVPFEERQQHYLAVREEWFRALVRCSPCPNPDEFAQRFVMRIREWVEAVRFAHRNAPPAAMPVLAPAVESGPVLEAAAPEVPLPDFVRVPPAAPAGTGLRRNASR